MRRAATAARTANGLRAAARTGPRALSLATISPIAAPWSTASHSWLHYLAHRALFHCPAPPPGHGHRQRHAGLVFRRWAPWQHGHRRAALRATAQGWRRHPGHRRRVDPSREHRSGPGAGKGPRAARGGRCGVDVGADIVNDIRALRQPGAATVVAAHPRCGVCLMHMHRDPQTMQLAPMHGDVLSQGRSFLERAADDLLALGVANHRIVVDPGIGFGKTPEQNFALLAKQPALLAMGYPLLVGWSRKSSLGAATGLALEQRLVPSVTAAVLAVDRGASVGRVHDVRETVAELGVWAALQQAGWL